MWPPPSPPCATMKSRPACLCARACLIFPQRAPINTPWLFTSLITSSGGVPNAFANSFTFFLFNASWTCGSAVACVQPRRPPLGPLLSSAAGTPCSLNSFSTNALCSAGIDFSKSANNFSGSS